jgi:hypothetical protein
MTAALVPFICQGSSVELPMKRPYVRRRLCSVRLFGAAGTLTFGMFRIKHNRD